MRILNIFANLKNYQTRANSYLSIINFILLFANFKSQYKLQFNTYIFVIIAIVLVILIGYFDHKYILPQQTIHLNTKNDIKWQLDRIEKKLDLK